MCTQIIINFEFRSKSVATATVSVHVRAMEAAFSDPETVSMEVTALDPAAVVAGSHQVAAAADTHPLDLAEDILVTGTLPVPGAVITILADLIGTPTTIDIPMIETDTLRDQ